MHTLAAALSVAVLVLGGLGYPAPCEMNTPYATMEIGGQFKGCKYAPEACRGLDERLFAIPRAPNVDPRRVIARPQGFGSVCSVSHKRDDSDVAGEIFEAPLFEFTVAGHTASFGVQLEHSAKTAVRKHVSNNEKPETLHGRNWTQIKGCEASTPTVGYNQKHVEIAVDSSPVQLVLTNPHQPQL
ncbi:hypothetical protein C8R47DRAFT_1070276 [Mycena vitilis]|nr:hypothetical protein C8R47DRAFT_1070276 [Mycena vitilis]